MGGNKCGTRVAGLRSFFFRKRIRVKKAAADECGWCAPAAVNTRPALAIAEQDLRMMKAGQKISDCFRTATGAGDFAVLRTVLSTPANKAGASSKPFGKDRMCL
jgi:hypothetical protein